MLSIKYGILQPTFQPTNELKEAHENIYNIYYHRVIIDTIDTMDTVKTPIHRGVLGKETSAVNWGF